MKVTAILACAGKGARAKQNKNKLLVEINGQTYLEKTLSAFSSHALIDDIIITASKEDFDLIKNIVGDKASVVIGGNTRTESVKNALALIDDGIVLIHDGARPFVSEKIIKDCIESVKKFGSAVTAFPSRDTILWAKDEKVEKYLGKEGLYSVQTPQAFFVKEIKKAYDLAGERTFNDDGEVFATFISTPHIVEGSASNVKITFPEDITPCPTTDVRFGVGFDCHRLTPDRKLILGGVEIPHDKGLLGHSDADVVTHAIMDAILSSLSLRDIGYHFPDKDPKYKGANSMELLSHVLGLIEKEGYKVDSVSACIMAEKPKLLPHIPKITESLASALNVAQNKVGITATTLEGLGFVGREEGICVHATAVVVK
ncbi:MAG: 2-C-methyl-D-erythritol 2,4-cyclodiphosphate synthase [Clostridia bacterium]|nr:2-C-methyl-D-erythritol 2,4-cyclodiphosphate synthase [Clostridia bacterium]